MDTLQWCSAWFLVSVQVTAIHCRDCVEYIVCRMLYAEDSADVYHFGVMASNGRVAGVAFLENWPGGLSDG